MKVLFIAYYFEPFSGVGAKRMSYWAKNLQKKISLSNNVEVTVLTASPQDKAEKADIEVIYVPDNKPSLLSKVVRTDKGASWYGTLKSFLKKYLVDKPYDAAVISGNPFIHFLIAPFLKRRGIKVILDFRDPFAKNPRTRLSILGRAKMCIFRGIERYFVMKADAVITVNRQCCELISGYSKYKSKFHIIDNGYDETILKAIGERKSNIEVDQVKFVYAGSLYFDRDPTVFLSSLAKETNFSFHHIGMKSEFLRFAGDRVSQYGILDYQKTLEIINECHVGMLFTHGYEFESTTKIFDYIGLGKIVWVISERELHNGAISEIAMKYPNIIWTVNDPNEIMKVLVRFKRGEIPYNFTPSTFEFSRDAGLDKLTNVLSSISYG